VIVSESRVGFELPWSRNGDNSMTTRVRVCVFGLLSGPLLAQGGFDGPGRYEITNLKSGRTLTVDRRDQSSVLQFGAREGDDQIWDIRPGPDGFFFLRNGMNGYALDAGGGGRSEPVRAVPFNGGGSQQWRIQPGKDGNPLIISRMGRTLDVPNGSSRDGVRLQVYDQNGDSNQRFIFRRVAGRDWDWDRERDRDRDQDRGQDRGRDADRGRGQGASITCSSNDGRRAYCQVDTRDAEVRMVRQISGSPCRQGETWGWDGRGIWVDRGCRAEFVVQRR